MGFGNFSRMGSKKKKYTQMCVGGLPLRAAVKALRIYSVSTLEH